MQGLQVTSQWAIVSSHNAHNTYSFILDGHDDRHDHHHDNDYDDDYDDD